MKKDFSTVDITKLTPKHKILELVKESARPGDMCETLPGYIHEKEIDEIANQLGVSVKELKDNFLREVRAYNTVLHRPKHEAVERRLGFKPTDIIHQMPYGKCIFLDGAKPGEHKCMLGDSKPLHCKIASNGAFSEKLHAWYLLNHAVKTGDKFSLREWAIYLKTHPSIPGGELHELIDNPQKLNAIFQDEVHED